MNQFALNFDQACAQRDVGMELALEHAEAVNEGWKDEAYSFLVAFAKYNRDFISEDVSDAHVAAQLPQPPTKRAWGSLYRRAARDGVIEQCGMGRSRLRHASICPRWRSRIFGSAA